MLMGLHRGEDSTLSRVEEVLVNDGEWHHLQLDISSLGGAASLHKAVLSLDQGLYLVSHGVPGSDGGGCEFVISLVSCSFYQLRHCCISLQGQHGGRRAAARLQDEDCERRWRGKDRWEDSAWLSRLHTGSAPHWDWLMPACALVVEEENKKDGMWRKLGEKHLLL